MRPTVTLVCALVAGCTNLDILKGAVPVSVDGQELFARPLEDPGTWQAGPVHQMEHMGMSPAEYLRFSRAIEQVSDCKVVPGAERWANGYLITAVDCG